MNILSKIFFWIISFLLIMILVYITYLTSTYTNSNIPYYQKLKEWIYKIKNENDNFSLEKITEQKSWSWIIFYKNIWTYDKVIYSTWNINLEKKEWKNTFNLEPWLYYFEIKDLEKKYKIKWNWFEIENKWPWAFFVNNIDSTKYLIFSESSLLELNLKNTKNNDQITSIDLYPHTYLIFNPIKNIFLRNSDLLKISQTFSFWFLNEEIWNNDELSNKFTDLITLRKHWYQEYLKNTINYVKKEYDQRVIKFDKIKSSSFNSIAWEKYIAEYSNYLINDSKKSIFIKNIIIRNLNKLINSEKVNPEVVNNIIKNLNTLNQIDKKWYNEIKELINYYYETSLIINADINTKINISSILKNINNEKLIIENKSLVNLEKTFFDYDYISRKWFYKKISDFRKSYFEELGIKIDLENWEKLYINEFDKIDYLLFFMENIIISSDFNTSNSNSSDLIKIFNDYVKISNYFYEYSDEKIKRTWIFTNAKILEKLKEIIENTYFHKERNKNWVLVLNEEIKIDQSEIKQIKQNIDKISVMYDNQKWVLQEDINEKDKIVKQQYKILISNFEEFFAALENYNDYSVKFDKNKVKLLSWSTLEENKKWIVISYDSAINFLNKFNWIRLNLIEVKIMDKNYCLYPSEEYENIEVKTPYCYKINNIYIDWKNIWFLLHPFEKNNIDEITINNIARSWSYELDKIEKTYEEKRKTESENSEKYNFKNYLIEIFWEKQSWPIPVNPIDPTPNIEPEDKVVKIFKRNKLLWTSWDFNSLNWFLDILYNNITVKRNENWEYAIFLQNTNFKISSYDNIEYNWIFESNYVFDNKHSFVNPTIKFLDRENSNELLQWNKIYIFWEYKVNLIKSELIKLINQFSTLNKIVNSIYYILEIKDVKITYYKLNNQIVFNTSYKWENLYIKVLDWNITKITYNNKSYIDGDTNYLNIDKILNDIK